jgi:hypothetical protein
LCLEGSLGLWFPRTAHLRMLTDLKLGKAALSLQPKLERQIELANERIALLELDAKTLDKIAEQWRTAATSQAKVLTARRSWLHDPKFWFAAGLVLGAGGVIAAVVAK